MKEAVHKIVCYHVIACLNNAAPGLSQSVKEAIGVAIALRLSNKFVVKPMLVFDKCFNWDEV